MTVENSEAQKPIKSTKHNKSKTEKVVEVATGEIEPNELGELFSYLNLEGQIPFIAADIRGETSESDENENAGISEDETGDEVESNETEKGGKDE